jgi:hypothetical protein
MELEITSQGPGASGPEFEQDCQKLLMELELEMGPENVAAAKKPEGSPADERFGLEIFHQLIVAGTNLGLFSAAYNVIKLWLSNRPTYEVTMKCPSGMEIKMTAHTLDDAQKLFAVCQGQTPAHTA